METDIYEMRRHDWLYDLVRKSESVRDTQCILHYLITMMRTIEKENSEIKKILLNNKEHYEFCRSHQKETPFPE
jgi:hypothetical protein